MTQFGFQTGLGDLILTLVYLLVLRAPLPPITTTTTSACSPPVFAFVTITPNLPSSNPRNGFPSARRPAKRCLRHERQRLKRSLFIYQKRQTSRSTCRQLVFGLAVLKVAGRYLYSEKDEAVGREELGELCYTARSDNIFTANCCHFVGKNIPSLTAWDMTSTG